MKNPGSALIDRMPALRRAARAAGLIYSTDEQAGYRRRGPAGRFHYLDTRGRRLRGPATLNRLRRLAIPPAWTDVWINPSAHGHVQASGRDARGRKQYIYHPDWLARRDETKFDQLVAFARALPHLRRAVAAGLRRKAMDRERATAVVVRLLETSLIRVGNVEYARANRSYGLTTLRSRHAHVSRGQVRFSFNGKGGIPHEIRLEDRVLAREVRRLQELPGQELFQYLDEEGRRHPVRSEDVNAFIREHTAADFTAKDFRTWAGTVLAAMELAHTPRPDTTAETQRAVVAAIRKVAARLGNTVAIARKSYIHPAVFEAFAAGTLPDFPAPGNWPPARPRIRLAPAERATLRLLRRAANHRSRPSISKRA